MCHVLCASPLIDIPQLEEVPSILAPPTTDGDDTSFASLSDVVSDKTLRAVAESLGFTHMTEVQHRSIRPLLDGRYTPMGGLGFVTVRHVFCCHCVSHPSSVTVCHVFCCQCVSHPSSDIDIVETHCCVIRERKILLSNSRNVDVI